jgi:serine/threonine protein phosphatase 1
MTEEHVSGTNKDYKIFAIGDIHGCLWSLEKLLNILPVNWGKDLVIFLGDYIDRGPNPKGVIEKVLELKELYGDKIIPLKGNHEWMFERFLKSYYKDGELKIPEEHLNFLKELKLYYETEDYIFVHAGLRPGKKLEEQNEEDLLWIRESFYFSEYKFPKTIVFGHTPFPVPLILNDRIGIDTGCVYGGKLTAIELPSKKIYQIDCGGEII